MGTAWLLLLAFAAFLAPSVILLAATWFGSDPERYRQEPVAPPVFDPRALRSEQPTGAQ